MGHVIVSIMAAKALALLAVALSGAAATVELTSANWDKEIAGKSAFIKFLAPW